jgi:hypothetical protein
MRLENVWEMRFVYQNMFGGRGKRRVGGGLLGQRAANKQREKNDSTSA